MKLMKKREDKRKKIILFLIIAILILCLISIIVIKLINDNNKDENDKANKEGLASGGVWDGFSEQAESEEITSQVGETTIDYYVALNGNDNNAGTIDLPFKTLEKARDAVRELKNNNQFTKPVNVYVREGVYEINQTFVLTSADSGTSDKPITYQAYPNEKVVISGGKKLNLDWQPYKDGIYVADVSDFVNKYGTFNSLFVNDERAVRAREPDISEPFPYYQIDHVDHVDEENTTSFYFNDNFLKSDLHNLQEIQIVSYRRWLESRFNIDKIQGNKLYIMGKLPYWRPYGWDYNGTDRYYMDNVFEGLDNSREWYLDKTENKLYYMPLIGEDITQSEFIAPVLDQILFVGYGDSILPETSFNTSNLIFRGLIFSFSDWKSKSNYNGTQAGIDILIPNQSEIYFICKDCIFDSNVISHSGLYSFGAVSQGLKLTNNHIYDSGWGAIKIGRNKVKVFSDKTDSNLVSNNKIHDLGLVNKEGVGIWVGLSGNNNVSNNLIYDGFYSGVSVGWRLDENDTTCKNNTIENNIIYNFMKVLNDGGGIYLVGKQPGTTINNNLVQNISFTQNHRDLIGVRALYLDEGSSNILAKNNLFYRNAGSLFLHVASKNSIQNNIFVDGDSYQIYTHSAKNNTLKKNIIYYTNQEALLFWIRNKTKDDPGLNYSDYNLFFSPNDLNITNKLEDWKDKFDQFNFDNHSIIADPLFADYFADNFTLLANSPALKPISQGGIEFEQIDFSDVGPQGVECFDDLDCLGNGECIQMRCVFNPRQISNYRFNGNSNNSTQSNHATLINGSSIINDVVKGQVLSLDGINDYAHINDNNKIEPSRITISFWLKPKKLLNNNYIANAIISKRDNFSNGYFIFAYNKTDTINIDFGGFAQRWNTGYIAPLNQWTNLVYTYNGTSGVLYVNGVYYNSTSKGNSSAVQSSNPLKIGADNQGYFFNGSIDDLKIWNYALNSSEVYSEFICNKDSVCDNSMGENEGNCAEDCTCVPTQEICNNLDDDCDGQTDEDSLGNPLTQECYSADMQTKNIGTCHAGIQTCSSGLFGSCIGEVTPQEENCDAGNLDEDCDASNNEGCICVSGATQTCGSNTGECRFGNQICVDNAWGLCTGNTLPVNEICDNKDNDCDGNSDESLTQATTCGVGKCAGNTGTKVCSAGSWINNTCNPFYGNVTETCNNIDDDCDGSSDEGLNCNNNNNNNDGSGGSGGSGGENTNNQQNNSNNNLTNNGTNIGSGGNTGNINNNIINLGNNTSIQKTFFEQVKESFKQSAEFVKDNIYWVIIVIFIFLILIISIILFFIVRKRKEII